jgi:hypothetical protein
MGIIKLADFSAMFDHPKAPVGMWMLRFNSPQAPAEDKMNPEILELKAAKIRRNLPKQRSHDPAPLTYSFLSNLGHTRQRSRPARNWTPIMSCGFLSNHIHTEKPGIFVVNVIKKLHCNHLSFAP